MEKKFSFGWVVGGVAIAIVAGLVMWNTNRPGQYDSFAECLKDNGAKFYGAFWCPHCQSQKREFGRSERLLSYIECSTPDGRGQTIECKEKGIQSYPTWIFANGEKITGEIPLATLAEKTGCQL
jgi:thiol-disulfide isomerase/thioredoxin